MAGAALLLLLGGSMMAGDAAHGAPPGSAGDPRARLDRLRAEVAHHDELYFKQAAPEITDADYDRLRRELTGLEHAHPDWAGDPPGAVPGDDRSGRFPTQAHRVRMLSLAKAYSKADWRAFHARVTKQLGQPNAVFVIEPKYDGLAISLTYERGVLVSAVTRGNGTEGDDVTANLHAIGRLPRVLSAGAPDGSRNPVPELVELRGEVYMRQGEFARVNAERESAGEDAFAHPRNLAVGTLKSSGPGDAGRRELSLVIYDWGAWDGGGGPPATQRAFHERVKAWGLPGVENFRAVRAADEAWAAVQAFLRDRAALDFPIDGAVVKLDDTALRFRLGADERVPHWAIACKFESERAATRLRAITIQVGRTGVLTPVAELDPVMLGGATVSRASLHNRDLIARRDIRVGDCVTVERAGDVIPAIAGVVIARRPAGANPYHFPDRCPSCGGAVAAKAGEVAVRCPNTHCPAQLQRRLEHFASAQGVGIRGLGPATIAALIRSGAVHGAADLYLLRRESLRGIKGAGGRAADRLLAEVERSKRAELWRFIHGLSIEKVGAATARDLARLCGGLPAFLRLQEADLAATVGPAVAESVGGFLARTENRADIHAMLAAGVSPQPPAGPSGSRVPAG